MSIRVLKRGISSSDYLFQATCKSCGSELDWRREDGFRYHAGDQRDPTPFSQVRCPVCTHKVTGYEVYPPTGGGTGKK
jgi:endogenous inhibitor of DNA gyrase (YacG/DUF329 family)